jgi:hypothetical protein
MAARFEDLAHQPAVDCSYLSAYGNFRARGLPRILPAVERLNLAASVQLMRAVLAINHAAPPTRKKKKAKGRRKKENSSWILFPSLLHDQGESLCPLGLPSALVV